MQGVFASAAANAAGALMLHSEAEFHNFCHTYGKLHERCAAICNLINRGGLSYEQYIEIRTEYISENPNLWIFEISAPRGFGESFAQTYIQGKSSKLNL
jgi:hypothetical protein